jgi:hypothetical protein
MPLLHRCADILIRPAIGPPGFPLAILKKAALRRDAQQSPELGLFPLAVLVAAPPVGAGVTAGIIAPAIPLWLEWRVKQQQDNWPPCAHCHQ